MGTSGGRVGNVGEIYGQRALRGIGRWASLVDAVEEENWKGEMGQQEEIHKRGRRAEMKQIP